MMIRVQKNEGDMFALCFSVNVLYIGKNDPYEIGN